MPSEEESAVGSEVGELEEESNDNSELEEDHEEDEEEAGDIVDDDVIDSPIQSNKTKKRKLLLSQFIDDEAELSGDDEVSEDEAENSDDDQNDLDLVDQEAKDLDSEEEEEIRGLYHKQLETEDKRALLLLQEQFEDKDVAIGQRRTRKFRWQMADMAQDSLKRHYDPDDEDSQDLDDDDDDDCMIYDETKPRLRRPTAESLLIGTTRITTKTIDDSKSLKATGEAIASTSGTNTVTFSDDSNSMSRMGPPKTVANSSMASKMDRYLFRDKELVEALSTKETIMISRENRDRNVQKELKKVQSKSVFDLIYS